jgi:hypothetical protein
MKVQMIKSVLVAGIMLTSVSGCGTSFFSTRQTNPVVTDYMGIWPFPGAVGTFSPDASRRITIIRLANTDKNYSPDTWREGEFCAEPPPDAMVNAASQFAVALAANIKASAPQGGGIAAEGSGNGEMVQQIVSSMSPLLRRSQGLQWARDNLSFVCNAHLNRVISKAQYLDLVKDIILRSDLMIQREMSNLPAFASTVTSTTTGNVTGSITGASTATIPPSK